MRKCEKCNEWRLNECHCKPFIVINEDGDDYEVQAMDKEDAALKYAELSNEMGDYYLMNETVEIKVNGTKFRISAEPDVRYSANKI